MAPDLVFGANCFAIGGRADLTTITKAGATTRTLRTWPDRIGEKINPFAGNVVPITAGMTRQQRRAAERQARKRA